MYPNSYSALGLSTSLVRVLAGLRLTEPTAIQHKTILHALAGRDVLVSAETGSGKTAAFVQHTGRDTGKPRGFAFIEYSEWTDIEEAMRRFNN